MGMRQERVSDQIRDEISRLIQREVRDPRIGFVTVTGASVTADLRIARVYISVLGEPATREESLHALQSAAGYLRRALFKKLRLRYSPALEFILDESLDRGERIESLLRDIREEREAAESVDEI